MLNHLWGYPFQLFLYATAVLYENLINLIDIQLPQNKRSIVHKFELAKMELGEENHSI